VTRAALATGCSRGQNQSVKKFLAPAASLAVFFAALLSTGAALACPGMTSSSCGSSCSGLGGYMAALGVGLLAGIGSVSLEGLFRRNK